ncbi:DNA-directed RNA polymerase II subunit GRINL1A-like [Ptychodera flava]|uniref:DNA-directed RNA polymerase II subunit GRINL1A-like n=1 Tax=Ptychodera flava TaxID=63121 RepID=UPI00396A6DD2
MAHLHKQGELGNLENLTVPELTDLLKRQEKLLANEKFLQKLSDKGHKIRIFAERLQLMIKKRQQVEQAAELFEKMKIDQENFPGVKNQLDSDDDEDDDITESKEPDVDSKGIEKTDSDSASNSNCHEIEGRTLPEKSAMDNYRGKPVKKISEFKKRMSTQPGIQPGNPFLKTQTQKKDVFRPSKTLRSNKLPDDIVKPEPLPMKLSSDIQRDKVEEISAVMPPKIKHVDGSQLLEISESILLEQEQQKKYEELCAKQAAERLARRMNVTMEAYIPDQGDMAYREHESDEGNDTSDDETSTDED